MSDNYINLAGELYNVRTLPYGDVAQLCICRDCGSLVGSIEKHDMFHQRLLRIEEDAQQAAGGYRE